MKPIVYFAPWCPDTEPFFAELNRLGVEFEALDMAGDRANFKAFLKLRDTHPAFDEAKKNSYIGIPALVLENGDVVLDKDELAKIFNK
ncbi:hypothetical protein EXH44_07385 [Actinobacillus indolicus]|uniref:Glutaredoxin-related protein n=2 Tax=Actinobacillus TaxID=713 RepID=A0A4P7CGD3_9PAST|nr:MULTISPECIES: hypothetical protein [Actinobacillus]AWI50089.1 hypothetical protein DDU33_00600 [Actinobacillus porcitonsillarum]QBQ64058.1 hypothetical protein EXH44_07385 [Actinobacillus indolicus]